MQGHDRAMTRVFRKRRCFALFLTPYPSSACWCIVGFSLSAFKQSWTQRNLATLLCRVHRALQCPGAGPERLVYYLLVHCG